jgi:hypothetical protein
MAGTVTKTRTSNFRGEKREITWNLVATGDASAGTVPNATIKGMEGWYLERVVTWPSTGGTAPDAYTFDIQDTGLNDLAIIDLAARSTTLTEQVPGSITLNQFPKINGDLTVIFGSPGASKIAYAELLFTLEH